MAGGKSSRMGYRNKPMIDIFGKPMIWYIINALRSSSKFDAIFCASNNEEIIEYVESNGVKSIRSEGKGYGVDLSSALSILKDRVFVTPADLPLLNARLVDHIIERSKACKGECISVMVKKIFIDEFKIDNRFCKRLDDEICYTGISIIDASKGISKLEEEFVVIDDLRLAINVNSEHELRLVKDIFKDYLTS